MIHIPIKIHMKTGGEFRLWTINPDGTIGDDTDWFSNLVTDVGLINMTTVDSWANRFSVGSSGAPHNVTESALSNFIAANNTSSANIEVNLGGTPNFYQAQTTATRRWIKGAIADTVREIGISNTTNNTNMSILNSVTPEIAVSDQQILDASYRLTTWPSLVDGTGIINIFGDDYDYTVRMGNIDLFVDAFNDYRPSNNPSLHRAYNGDIGLVTELPAGDDENSTTVEITSQGSGFCNYTVTFGVDQGNVAGGIQSIASLILSGGISESWIQVEFKNRGEGAGALDSPIPKNNTREISFDLGITWGRHV